ncbi:MAG: LVIVD repeat-containing protein [Lacibacter sp.]
MTRIKPYALLLLPVLFFSSCLKDKCTQTYTIYRPVYKTRQEVYADIKSKPARVITSPGKITLFGSYIFLNEINKGIHVIDNSNPSQPKNLSFIEMPGNVDLAMKGNRLYADLYNDLITLDITNPTQVSVAKITTKVFPHRMYTSGFVADTNLVIVDWNTKDTSVEIGCSGTPMFGWFDRSAMLLSSFASGGTNTATVGINGSMARFALKNEYLYTVSTTDLKVFGLQNPDAPQQLNTVQLGWGIETIFPFKDHLFIGSNTGMFIYSLQNPSAPVKKGAFAHVLACDPVIADDTHAYVTLRSGNNCRAVINQLDVLDIANLQSPSLLKTYQLTNPHGLSKDGNLLFVCDGKDGLKVYDAASPTDLKLIKQFKGFEAYDVIAWNGNALVVTKTALLQFDYSNTNNIQQRSSIAIQK